MTGAVGTQGADPPEPPGDGSRATAISTAVVRVVARFTGRTPANARTHEHGDLIVVVLEDTLTPGDRLLIAAGHAELVRATRRALQTAMHDDLVAAVEAISGRGIEALLSDDEIDPDLVVRTFVLAPA